MRKVREILRLHTAHHLTGRQIAHSLGLSHSTVMGVLHRAEALGLTWPLPEELDDATLEGRLYPPTPGRPVAVRAWGARRPARVRRPSVGRARGEGGRGTRGWFPVRPRPTRSKGA